MAKKISASCLQFMYFFCSSFFVCGFYYFLTTSTYFKNSMTHPKTLNTLFNSKFICEHKFFELQCLSLRCQLWGEAKFNCIYIGQLVSYHQLMQFCHKHHMLGKNLERERERGKKQHVFNVLNEREREMKCDQKFPFNCWTKNKNIFLQCSNNQFIIETEWDTSWRWNLVISGIRFIRVQLLHKRNFHCTLKRGYGVFYCFMIDQNICLE